nr:MULTISPECIES: beta-lactamase family protein [unclassified Streptomyces]
MPHRGPRAPLHGAGRWQPRGRGPPSGRGQPTPLRAGQDPGGRAFIDAPGDGGFATARDLVRFARAPGEGTVLHRNHAELFTGPEIPLAAEGGGLAARRNVPVDASFGTYPMPVGLVSGQRLWSRAGADPGVGAGWSIRPDTGWIGVIFTNRDGAPLGDMGHH